MPIQRRFEEYLETVKDFDVLISPPPPVFIFPLSWSRTFQQSLKTLRPSKRVSTPMIFFFLFFSFLKKGSSFPSSFSRMMTRFSNAKLAEAQEENAKAGLIGGLLSRKRQRENEPSKEETTVTSSMAKSQDSRLASPTSSLELTISLGGGFKAKTTRKILIASFWEDAGTTAQKANDTISVEDLEPLMGKPPLELMSSHVHKLM